MTDTKQSEAPRLADEGESGVEHKDKRTEQLMRELAAECRTSAEQKLRADQLAQQHRMQREINHADGETILALRAENEQLRAALTEAVPDDVPSQPKADSKDFPAEWAVAMWKGRERIRKELRASNGQAPAQPAPQQEAQEPFAWFTDWHPDGRKYARKPHGFNELGAILDDPDLIREVWKPLYAAPQPSPVAQGDAMDSGRLDWLALAGPVHICLVIDRGHDGDVEVSVDGATGYGKTLRAAIDAARAAQEGNQ